MKKLLAILLCLSMLLSMVLLASCKKTDDQDKGKETESQSQPAEEKDAILAKTPKDVYAAAQAAAAVIQNGTVDVTVLQSVTMEGVQQTTELSQLWKFAGDLAYCKISMGGGYGGELWYDGTYAYENYGEDDKYKEEVSKDDFISYAGWDDIHAILIDLSDSAYTGKEFVKNADGNYTLTLAIVGDDLEAFQDVFGSDGAKDDKIDYVLTFDKNGNLIDAKFAFVMVADELEIDVQIAIVFSAMGTTAVTLPADLDTYEEYDPAS